MANILIYALHYDGAINKNSLGAVSEGAKLAAQIGGEAHAILLGENVPTELDASPARRAGPRGAQEGARRGGPGRARPAARRRDGQGDPRRRLRLRAVRRRAARL